MSGLLSNNPLPAPKTSTRIAALFLPLLLPACQGTASTPLASNPTSQSYSRQDSTACETSVCIYTVNGSAIYIFPADARLKQRAQIISGPSTGFIAPDGIAIDADHNVYVSDYRANAIFVFAPGVTGNVRPVRTIAGDATLLATPQGIRLDPKGRLYVANEALFGGTPVDVALGKDGEIYVATGPNIPFTYESVNVYAPNSNGDVAPIRSISGSNTGIGDAGSIDVDSTGAVYVAHVPQEDAGAVLVFAPGASGNVEPARTISGYSTLLSPLGMTLAQDKIYVANGGGGRKGASEITVYPEDASGNTPPIQKIVGNPPLGGDAHLAVM